MPVTVKKKTAKVHEPKAACWVKCTALTSKAECHRRWGTSAAVTWIPGTVNRGTIKPSFKGKNMKCVNALFNLGGDTAKRAETAVSSVECIPPADANVPEDMMKFEQDGGLLIPLIEDPEQNSVHSTDTDETVDPDTNSVQRRIARRRAHIAKMVEADDKEAEEDHPSTGTVLPPTERPRPARVSTTPGSVTCNDCDWVVDGDAVNMECNGAMPEKQWSMKDTHRGIHTHGSDKTRVLS